MKATEIFESDRRRQLPRAISSEVEAHHLVALAHGIGIADYGGLDEFVILLRGIGCFDCGPCRLHLFSLPLDNGSPGALSALPAFITIHRIVASGNGGNAPATKLAQFLFKLFNERQGRARGFVAPVEHRMYGNILNPLFDRHFEQRQQMADMTMHTAVG